MELEEALRELLIAESSVTDLVGQRIRPDTLLQADAMPGVVITIEEEIEHLDLESDGGLIEATVEVTAISEQKSEAREVARALKAVLRGFTGDAGDLFLQAIQLERTTFDWIAEDDGSDSGWHEITGVYTIWKHEN